MSHYDIDRDVPVAVNITPADLRAAALALCSVAPDAQSAREVLEALGLPCSSRKGARV